MDTDLEELSKCSACSATKLEMLRDFKDVPLVRYFPIGGTENLIYLFAIVLIQCLN